MTRFIIRHAKADPYSESGSDDDRPLTDKGNAQAEYLANALAALDEPPARVISSPILRAHQTARCIADALRIDIEFEHALSTHAYSTEAMDFFDEISDTKPTAIVGHNPTFSIIASQRGASPISLKTGMCVVLDCSGAPAAVRDIIRMPKGHSG